MRPLVYEFQKDSKVYDESFQFMFGRDILVANVLEEGATSKEVYLPEGTKWYEWNNNFACHEGATTIKVPVTIESIPMFLREGSIVPMAKNQLMSMENDHVSKMHFIMVPGEPSTMTLYDDDGVTNSFKKGDFRKTNVTMEGQAVVKVNFTSEGTYEDKVLDVSVEMIRKDRSPYWVTLGEQELTHYFSRSKYEESTEGWYYSQTKRAVEIKYPNPRKNITLTVSFEDFDLIGM